MINKRLLLILINVLDVCTYLTYFDMYEVLEVQKVGNTNFVDESRVPEITSDGGEIARYLTYPKNHKFVP